MLEAEIPEGDLSQITTAIQNALKSTTTVIQQRVAPALAASFSDNLGSDVEIDAPAAEGETAQEAEVPRAPREPKPRKPISMSVLEIDLTSEPSLSAFSSTHPAKNDTERYLVALAWF